MRYLTVSAAVLIALAFTACEKKETVVQPVPVPSPPAKETVVVPTPVPTPGPQGPAGAPGPEGPKGEPGKPGGTVVIVPPPAEEKK